MGQNIKFLPSPSPTRSHDPGFLLHFHCPISISMDYPRKKQVLYYSAGKKNGKELLKTLDSLHQVTKTKLLALGSCKVITENKQQLFGLCEAEIRANQRMNCHVEKKILKADTWKAATAGTPKRMSVWRECKWHLGTKSASWQLNVLFNLVLAVVGLASCLDFLPDFAML